MRLLDEQFIKKNHNRKILFICGTMNTTTMMHEISKHLQDFDCYFSHMYADGLLDFLAKNELLGFVPLSGTTKENTINYFKNHNLKIDFYGKANNYDLVVTCTDLIIPNNIKNTKIVHVQEGMTDPENYRYLLVKYLGLPNFIGSTSMMGMSDVYDVFCVASEGFKELFLNKGINPSKIRVTGIPNYDNCIQYSKNDFPHKNYVLVATSDYRETFKYENRKLFNNKSLEIANGRQLIFKLHPNENFNRAIKEINKYAPESIIYTSGNVHEMIANCEVLITKYSTVVFTGIALGKEVYSDVDIEILQNDGNSSKNIAEECRNLINSDIKLIRNTNSKQLQKVNHLINS